MTLQACTRAFHVGDSVYWYKKQPSQTVPAEILKIGPRRVLILANMVYGDRRRWVSPLSIQR